jgi:carboxylesterase type B
LSEQLASTPRDSPTYMYHFKHEREKMRFVTHFSEVPFVFHWEYAGFKTQADQDMTDVLATYWGNYFASNGQSPSGELVGLKGLPEWPAFTETSQSTILLEALDSISVAAGIKQDECAFFIPRLDAEIRALFA